MVLPAVLRHPARHPQQTPGCNCACSIDYRAGFYAVARYFAGSFSQLSAAVPAVFVYFLCCCDRARLSRGTRADGWLCHPRAHSHHLLFRILLCDPACIGPVRENQAAAEFDLRIGTPAWHSNRSIGAAVGPIGVEEAADGEGCGTSVSDALALRWAPPYIDA